MGGMTQVKGPHFLHMSDCENTLCTDRVLAPVAARVPQRSLKRFLG